MKLSSSFRIFFALYFAALIFCLGARIWLKLNAMDPETGFYIGNTALVNAFNIVLALCIASLLLFYLFNRTDRDYPVLRGDKITAFFALLTGLAIAFLQLETLQIPGFGAINPGVALSGIPLIVSAVFGWFSSLVFIFIGGRALFSKGIMRDGIFFLIAGVWLMLTLVFKFNSYTTLTTVSDNLLAVLFMLFCSLFLTGHARTLEGLSRKDGRNYAIPTGLSASLCGILLVVPNWIWAGVNQSFILPAPMLGSFESVLVFLLSIYALLFVRHISLSIRYV